MKRLNVLFSASPACVLKNVNWPLSCASMSIASILPRNRRASTLTCTRKLEREATHRALLSPPSADSDRADGGHEDQGRNICPCCGCRMVIIETFEPGCQTLWPIPTIGLHSS